MSTHVKGIMEELNSKPDKERFMQMLENAGYSSMRQFALANDISPANLSDRVQARYVVSVPMCYKIAEGLGCPLINVIEVFFPELVSANERNARGTYRDTTTGEVMSYKKMVDYCRENYDYGDETNYVTYMNEWYKEYDFEKVV